MANLVSKLFYRVSLSRPLTQIYDHFLSIESLGKRGELAAERFLLRNGLVIVDRGYQDKFGEIDLIAIDDRAIVFVEVKTRTSDYAGDPADAVDEIKQQHLTKPATGYLKWHQLTECQVRFDVIAITWPSDESRPVIEHYQNAFEPVGKFQMF